MLEVERSMTKSGGREFQSKQALKSSGEFQDLVDGVKR